MSKIELSHDQKLLINWVIDVLALVYPMPMQSLTAKLILEICFSDTDTNKSLRKDIKQLKETHLESAYDYLGAAMRVENPARRETLIDDARREFTQASHLQDTDFNIAKAQYQVGLCFALIDDPDNARDWYEKSYKKLKKSMAKPPRPSSFISIIRFLKLEAKVAKDRQRKLTFRDRMRIFLYVEATLLSAFTIVGLPVAWWLMMRYTDLLIKAGYEFDDSSINKEQVEFARLLRTALTNENTSALVVSTTQPQTGGM